MAYYVQSSFLYFLQSLEKENIPTRAGPGLADVKPNNVFVENTHV